MGLLVFVMPCLYLNLKRIENNRDCFVLCYRHSVENIGCLEEVKQKISSDELENCINIDQKEAVNEFDIMAHLHEQNSQAKYIYSADHGIHRKELFDLLFQTRLKYFIVFLFAFYFILNIFLIIKYPKVDIPLTEIIPSQSYLKKHMVNHQSLFQVGPIITIAFMKQLNYWDKNNFTLIRNFLDDAKKIKSVDNLFEMNWLQETYFNSKQTAQFYQECEEIFTPLCFERSFNETITKLGSINGDMYYDDVVYSVAKSRHDSIENEIQIKSSRFYLQYKNFFGSTDEVDAMHELKFLAKEKYNLTEELIIFSPVFVYFEQLDELLTSFVSFFVLNLESIILVAFLFIFDVKSIVILAILVVSFVISILANLFLLGYSLNIITLIHFLMVPSFISEFFFGTGYLILYKKQQDDFFQKESLNTSNSDKHGGKNSEEITISTANDKHSVLETPNKNSLKEFFILKKGGFSIFVHKAFKKYTETSIVNTLKFIYYKSIKHSSFFLIFLLLANFSIMIFCTTYSFRTLHIILTSSFFNLFLHLYFFYPALNFLFGNF